MPRTKAVRVPKPTGRPTLYTEALAETICVLLKTGYSLRAICDMKGFPDRSTVTRWMETDAAFASKCARARDMQADLMDDRILDVANKVESGELTPDVGRVVVSALQWRAAKLKPKKYGDVSRHELTGADGGPITLAAVDARERLVTTIISGQKVLPKPDDGGE
jgi:hypothetical protein